eukprot:TRINITY_DN15357_c0_g1_i3.p1 TRINITY_DN15357_c0_g1~~TRINITY_DN15357_c0_g1_i3.p1  ORF type:complete len:869 (+),score=191.71 TRINITY_DN15357_c0_g1_i3:246-2852(+)
MSKRQPHQRTASFEARVDQMLARSSSNCSAPVQPAPLRDRLDQWEQRLSGRRGKVPLVRNESPLKNRIAIWEARLSPSHQRWTERMVSGHAGSRPSCKRLAELVRRGLELMELPEEHGLELEHRLGAMVAMSSGDSTTQSWLEAGAALCAHVLGWISFSAMAKHEPSASGLIRRSRLRVRGLQQSSWSLEHSTAERSTAQWREWILVAQSTLRAELDQAFNPPVNQAFSPDHDFDALASQLEGWKELVRGGRIRMADRKTAAEMLQTLWQVGEEGVRRHVSFAVQQVASLWRVPEGVVACHGAIESVVIAEREDLIRSIGETHARVLFRELFELAPPPGLTDKLSFANSVLSNSKDLEKLCLRARWYPSLCGPRSCAIDLAAVHLELQRTGFAAIEAAVADSLETLEATTVRDCCVWQANAQRVVELVQQVTISMSRLRVDPHELTDDQTGWSPVYEGCFAGRGGELLEDGTELAAIQAHLAQELELFGTLGVAQPTFMRAGGMELALLRGAEPEERRKLWSLGAMVPLAGLAALGELEGSAISALGQGGIVQLSLEPSAIAPAFGSEQREASSRELSRAAAPRSSVVMAARAVRKTSNFVGAAVKAATAPTGLLFEVLSIATGQYYMHEINNKLDQIERTLSRQELREACANLGSLNACVILTEELKEEFALLSQLPADWLVRSNQVLRDTTHGLCTAEASVGSFLARVERFVQTESPKQRVELLKGLHAEMGSAQQDFTCLLGYSKVLLQLRELQALADLRAGSERTALSAMRVDDALWSITGRLALFGKLEEMVSKAERSVGELNWLQRNILNRSAGHYARQVVGAINDLQRSLNGSGERMRLGYLMTLSQDGQGVHVKAVEDSV